MKRHACRPIHVLNHRPISNSSFTSGEKGMRKACRLSSNFKLALRQFNDRHFQGLPDQGMRAGHKGEWPLAPSRQRSPQLRPTSQDGSRSFCVKMIYTADHVTLARSLTEMEDRRVTVTDALQSTTFRLYSSPAASCQGTKCRACAKSTSGNNSAPRARPYSTPTSS
jgi:hypothetical protein